MKHFTDNMFERLLPFENEIRTFNSNHKLFYKLPSELIELFVTLQWEYRYPTTFMTKADFNKQMECSTNRYEAAILMTKLFLENYGKER